MRRILQRRTFTLGLIAVVMVTAACSSPATKATTQSAAMHAASATPPAAAQELVSKRYGFQLTRPKAWSKGDAQVGWDGKEIPADLTGAPDWAVVADASTDNKFAVAAAQVAKGMQLAAWQATVARMVPVVGCVNFGRVRKTTLGGEPAFTWAVTCGGLHPTNIAALHRGRGYLAIAEVPSVDPRTLPSILRSFHFTG
jgi:hypothetical protein